MSTCLAPPPCDVNPRYYPCKTFFLSLNYFFWLMLAARGTSKQRQARGCTKSRGCTPANEQNSRQWSSARRIDVVGAPLRQSQASPAAHSPTPPETAIQRRAKVASIAYRNRAVHHGLLRRSPPKDVQRPPHALLPELRRGQGCERPKPCGNQNQPVARTNAPA